MEQSSRTTAAACSREACGGCEIEEKLICVAIPKDVVDLVVVFVNRFIPFLAGMMTGKFWIGLAA